MSFAGLHEGELNTWSVLLDDARAALRRPSVLADNVLHDAGGRAWKTRQPFSDDPIARFLFEHLAQVAMGWRAYSPRYRESAAPAFRWLIEECLKRLEPELASNDGAGVAARTFWWERD